MINNLKNAQKTTNQKIIVNSDAPQHYDMIAFCHLRWQFVYQRPQHIISRLASNMKVLFIEEPIHNDNSQETGNLITVSDNLNVLQPYVRDIESIANILTHYVKTKTIPIG